MKPQKNKQPVVSLKGLREYCAATAIIFLSFLLGVHSFSQTITIGTGNLLGDHPIYPYFGYTYSQSIYYQSEIATAGTITAIKFYYQGGSYTDAVVVYIGHTTKTAFSNTTDWVPVGSMTSVYSGNYSFGSATGWYQITLSTPFVYNNVDNLVIAVDENTSGYHSSSDDFHNTGVSGDRSIYYYSDGTNPDPSSPPTGTLSTKIANVQLVITPAAACSGTPTGGTANASPTSMCLTESSVITVSGATTGVSGLTYQWQSSPDNSVWSNISGATGTSYTATPSSGTYYRRVITCTNSGISANSASVQVTLNNCLIIGTGTSTTYSYPYRGGYEDARSQFILTEAELTATGLCAGATFTSLSFNVSSKASTAAYKSFTIKMGHTSSASFPSASWLAPAFTTVYSVNYTTAAGWNLHSFSTGFVWNGTDNVVIETCFNNTAYTSDDYVYYTTTSDNKVCYAEADGAAGCTLAAEWTSTSRPNMKFNYTPGANCSGTPTGGTAAASPSTICPGNSSSLTVTGSTTGCGITYQWQSSPDNSAWSNIGGATSGNYTSSPGSNTYYRRVITCTNSGLSSNSASVLVTVGNPTYATLPYSQMFEGPWLSYCNTRDVPDNSWKNTPASGNDSWRRQDDGVAAAGWGSLTGVYTPGSSQGSYSACFNGYSVCSSQQGSLDLYINLSPAGTKSLCFDYINDGSSDPDDVLDILLSTDGGATFPTTLLSLANVASWTSQTVSINSTSATCVIRFRATGDCGSSGDNIGIDNLSIAVPGVPNCATYTFPADGATNITCGINAILSWNAPSVTACNPATGYDVYFQAGVNPPTALVSSNQSFTTYNPGTLSPGTTYYWKILPRNSAGAASCATVWSFTTGASFNASQTTPPISDGFENCTDWVLVNGAQPNLWLRGTATAYTGSNSMYIHNGSGTDNDYDINSSSTVHFYKDITFPAGSNDYSLRFYWKAVGESCCDEMTVYFAPTSVTPVAGTEMSFAYNIGYAYNDQSPAAWQLETMTLPIACGGNETWRLIFSWHNDGSTGPNPPAAIDDIMITTTPRAGLTCANPLNVTLPFTRTGETTNCMDNDYSNASTSSCGSDYESGYDKVYKVLVGAAGCVSVSISNASSTSIGFQVYNGCPDVSGSTCIFNTTTGSTGGSLTADINIPSAGYYYFIVDNWAAPNYVNYDIAISAPGGNTINDAVCNATALTLGISASGDNTCTNAIGEPAAPTCWTTGTMNTVWYRITIPASKDLAIKTTAGSLLKTQIDVYRGNACGSLTYVDCNQDAASCGTGYDNSYLLINNIGAGTYAYIRVDGEDDLVGSFSIMVIDGNNGSPQWNNYPIVGQDCGPVVTNTNPICGQTTSMDNPGFFAYGNICDFTGSGICLASGERSSVWYTININANGNLEFDIVPNDYGNPNPITGQSNPGYFSAGDETDYDFAIWKWESACDGTGDGAFCCTEIAAGSTAATRCDYNGLGVSGLYNTAADNAPAAYSSFNGAYEARIAVTNGEVYVLAISNYANDYVSGYTLKFSATSPINYAVPGSSVSWSSNTSNAWSNPGNWGGCTPPSCTIDAVLSSGGAQPVISANATVKDLTINAGATLTINANCTLTVCGNFTNNGNLVMASTATLLFNNGSVAQSVNGSLTGANKIGNLVITKTGGSVTLNAAIDIGGNFTTTGATSVFNANNQTVKIAGNFSTAAAGTISNFPNIEFNGTIPQIFSNSSGTITWTNVTMNNSGGGITLTGTAASNLVIAGALTLTNGIIYTANPPLLIMNSASTVSGGSASSFVDGPMQKIGNTAFVFPVGDAFNRWARIGISNISASTTFQAQYIYTACPTCAATMAVTPTPVLNNVSQFEYWQLDRTGAAANASVTLYWENAGSSGINSCAALQGGDLVVARYNGSAWENRSSTITGGITGTCSGATAGTITSDVLTAFSPFTFGSKSAAVNPLPIELLYFTGRNSEGKNILEWKTAAEVNNDFFTLEHSKNGYEFEELAIVDGAGNSSSEKSYQYNDEKPYDGKTYYRLKQTDFDGDKKYAANIVLLENKHPIEFMLFPNPANNEIIIYTDSREEENITVEITDISGRKVMEQKEFVAGNGISIDISKYSEGIYFVSFRAFTGTPLSVKRFVKMK